MATPSTRRPPTWFIALLIGMVSPPTVLGQPSLVGVPLAKPAKQDDRRGGPSEPTLSQMKLPPDSVLILCDDPLQAIDVLRPKGVVLSPAYYQALLAKLARLERQQATTASVLGSCRVTGRVVRTAQPPPRDVVDLRLEIEFRTTAPDSQVPIGLRGMRLVSAKFDGEDTVPWGPEGQGLSLFVKEPKVHRLEVTTLVPLTRVGAESRLLLDGLPQAAITTLELAVPNPARIISSTPAGRVVAENVAGQGSVLRGHALGATNKLEVRWADAEQTTQNVEPRLLVRGDTRMSVEATRVATEARLLVEAQAGEIAALTLQLAADLNLLRVEDATGTSGLQWTYDRATGLLKITLGRPLRAGGGSEELRFWHVRELPAKSAALALSPGEVRDPATVVHTGVMSLALPPDAGYQVRGDDLMPTEPRQLPFPDPKATHAFRYWRQPVTLTLVAGQQSRPRVVEARYRNVLELHEASAELVCTLDLRAKLRLLPKDVYLQWPQGFQLDRRLLLQPLVEAITPLNEAETLWHLRLTDGRGAQVQLQLRGRRNVEPGQGFPMQLPRLVAAPAGTEVEPKVEVLEGPIECKLVTKDAWTRFEKTPAHLRRKDGAPIVPGQVLPDETDVMIDGDAGGHDDAAWTLLVQPGLRSMQADVRLCVTRRDIYLRQELHCRWQGQRPTQVQVSLPTDALPKIDVHVRHRRRGEETWHVQALEMPPPDVPEGLARVRVPIALPPDVGEEFAVVAEMTWPTPAVARARLAIPWIAPVGRDVNLTRATVRCWASPGIRLRADQLPGDWKHLGPRDLVATPGGASPLLGLRGTTPTEDLTLDLHQEAATSRPRWTAQNAVVTTALAGGSRMRYRLRMHLQEVVDDELTLTFPGADGWFVDEKSVRCNGQPAERATSGDAPTPRWRIPAAALPNPLEVECTYVAPPHSGLALGAYRLSVPQPGHDGVIERITWRVAADPTRILLPLTAGVRAEDRWTWHWWLRRPAPALADHQAVYLFVGGGDAGGWALLDVPRQTLLLLGSLVTFGLAMMIASQATWLRWTGLGVAFALVLDLVVALPHALVFAFYGAQPGLVASVALAMLRRWVAWHGAGDPVPAHAFSRQAPGSSLQRTRVAPAPSASSVATSSPPTGT